MHGLVNKAIEFFVRDTYGDAAWTSVVRRTGVEVSSFEAMLSYDDAVTDALLVAAAGHLAKPRDAILEDIGIYVVSHPDVTAPRRLLRFAGATFEDFLGSLEALPDWVRLALPDLHLPPMRLSTLDDGGVRLVCGSFFDGFGHVIVGLLQAMADEYGALVTITHEGRVAEGEAVHIYLHVPHFSEGRSFQLTHYA
ncbi:MAG: heme NO-binding domain-containing protein [Rhodobacteraceae bacterium]|jgi:hypothetical protein|nr:heme NO-binding domain-containing protein [Alphaproteobacteria bacterium]NNK65529.1 heme NO-binding domain-containing protein [Paracoccaceae bacterium]